LKNGIKKETSVKSRDRILKNLKSNQPDSLALPKIEQSLFLEGEGLLEKFCQAIESVGGKILESNTDIKSRILEKFPSAPVRYSTLEGWEDFNTLSIESISKPHDLENLDLFVTQASFGVSENAAVWLGDEQLPHRVLPFIAKQVVVILKRDDLVETMHEAYEHPKFTEYDFGLFLSGPSKTADIEQSLVIGAQGALGLSVHLI